MKFGGDFQSNLASAKASKNKDYAKDVILDEVARIIYLEPMVIAKALNNSGVKTSKNPTKNELIDKVVDNLYDNASFRRNIGNVISQQNPPYSYLDPSAIAGAVQAVAEQSTAIVNGIFGAVQRKQELNQEKERTKQLLYDKIFGQEKKNYMPIVLIGGVLLIGGVVLFLALRDKK